MRDEIADLLMDTDLDDGKFYYVSDQILAIVLKELQEKEFGKMVNLCVACKVDHKYCHQCDKREGYGYKEVFQPIQKEDLE